MLYVGSSSGKMVQINSLAKLRTEIGPLSIAHLGQLPAVTISFNLADGASLSDATADIAAAVHLHPSTAGAIFRKHTGVTTGQYLAQCRVAEAQRLLISTEATTTDIAHRAGFGSTSRFYATFLEHCQLAPAAYRRVLRGRDGSAAR